MEVGAASFAAGCRCCKLEEDRVTRLEFTCETCGARIADPLKTDIERPVRVCCRASLAKAKGKH